MDLPSGKLKFNKNQGIRLPKGMKLVFCLSRYYLFVKCKLVLRIQITLLLVFIFSRYWSKSIIRAPLEPQRNIWVKINQ